jgi:hypothetical protein
VINPASFTVVCLEGMRLDLMVVLSMDGAGQGGDRGDGGGARGDGGGHGEQARRHHARRRPP